MKKIILIALATIGLGVGAANAGVAFSVSVGSSGYAPRHCAPPVVYQACPPPVVYQPCAPVVVHRPVVVAQPYCAPRYYAPAPCHNNVAYIGGRHGGGGGYHHGHRSSGFHGSVSYRW